MERPDVHLPSETEFIHGCQEYARNEGRDAMYKVASFWLAHFWGQPSEMADGLGVLLLTWNQPFYRYGIFDFSELERCLIENLPTLEAYRQRPIQSLSDRDDPTIAQLFRAFLQALAIRNAGAAGGRQSPVGAAKALHLLAPPFFPLWDLKIAKVYGCDYKIRPVQAYLHFSRITQQLASRVSHFSGVTQANVLKRIDEYNYAKYTKGWI